MTAIALCLSAWPILAQSEPPAFVTSSPILSAGPSTSSTPGELLPLRGEAYLASVEATRRATDTQLRHVTDVISGIKAQIDAVTPHRSESGREEELADLQAALDIARESEEVFRQSIRLSQEDRQLEEGSRQANAERQRVLAEQGRPETGGEAVKDGVVTLDEADKARREQHLAENQLRERELAHEATRADEANLDASLQEAQEKVRRRREELVEARRKLGEERARGSSPSMIQLLEKMIERAELGVDRARDAAVLARRSIDLLARRRTLLAFQVATSRVDLALRRRRAAFLDERVTVSGEEIDAREHRWREKLLERDRLRTLSDQQAQRADDEREAAQTRRAKAEEEEQRAPTNVERELAHLHMDQAGYDVEIADVHQRLAELQSRVAQAAVDQAKEIFDSHSTMKDIREGRVSNTDLADRLSEVRSAAASVQLRTAEAKRQADEVRASRRAFESVLESVSGQVEAETARADATRTSILKALLSTRKTLSRLIAEKEDLAAQVAGLQDTLERITGYQAERQRRIEHELGISRIWERRPSELSWDQIKEMGGDLVRARDALTAGIRGAPQALVRWVGALGSLEAMGRVILLVGIAYIILVCVVFAQRRLRSVARRLPSAAGEGLSAGMLAACRVARRAIPFAAAVLLARAVGLLLSVNPQLWSGVEMLLQSVLLFSLARGILREVLAPRQPSRRLAAVSPAAASHIYAYVNLICIWSMVLVPLALWLPDFYALIGVGLRQASVELVWLVYKLGTALLVFFLTYEKEMLLALLPTATEGLTGIVRRAVRVLYPVLMLFVLSLFALGTIGYVDLARYLVRSTGGSLFIIGTAIAVQHLLRTWLFAVLATPDLPGQEPADRERSLQWADRTAAFSRWSLSLVVLASLYLVWGGDRETAAVVWGYLTLTVPFGPISFSVARLAEAMLTIYVALFLSRWIRLALERAVFPHTEMDRGVRYALSLSLHYFILAVALSYALETLGIGMEYVKWFVGAIGVGAGFGLQNIVYNVISGVVLLVEQPVRIGDFIEVGGVSGRVDKISIRSSTVRTDDNIEVIVPNSELMSLKVANWTHTDPVTKISVNVQIPYGTDPELVRHSLMDVAAATTNVLRSPAPWVSFMALGESALQFQLQVCCRDPGLRLQVQSDLNFAIERTFRRQHVPIAHESREIWSPAVTGAEGTSSRPGPPHPSPKIG